MRIPIRAGSERGGHVVLRLRGGCASLAAAPLRMTILLWAAVLGMTILLWCGMASATSYYVSNGGTDAAGCTTAATACKTLGYVDSSITLHAGDSVLLQRGGVWNEQLVATASGTSGSPILYDAYGTGPAPVITAAAPILPWTNGTGTPWSYVSGSTWRASVVSTIASPTVSLVQFGNLYGRKQPVGSGCASAVANKYDWCVSWPWLYVWSGNSSANPVSTYATDGAIVPIVSQVAGLAMISMAGKTWLTFQHIEVQNFDYMGVSVTGSSDNLVFANMEVDGMVPYGTTPLGFYVNVSSGYGTNIQFLNDDADLNYDGFRVDGAAAVTVKNCRGYANRDAGLKDNTASGTAVKYSYSHFYGNNVAQLLASDVVNGIAGSGNVGLACGAAAVLPAGMCSSTAGPVAVNSSPYPARFSFTVDDVGSQQNTEAYVDTFLGTGPFGSRGLHFNAAVVPSYSVIWSDVNNWYAAGDEIDSHSWSHQYYSTNTNPCGTSPCSPPYPNAPAMVIQYTGSGSAATLTISGTNLSTTVTGATGDSIPSFSLSSYTAQGLYTYLQSFANYTVQQNTPLWGTNIWPYSRPNTNAKNLAAVPSADIKTAPYALLYDQTKLEPDEMSSSKAAIQTNVAGLTESFYVYPDGIEDPTIEADAVAAGYTGARGSLAMKGQDNITASANSLYSNGVNVQNLTSLAAIQIHGLTQGQINQIAASLVFRAAAWGAPYGLFTHYNSRGDLTPDISNGELGYLLDAVTSNGGQWYTNMALASAVTSLPAIGFSGTTRYIQSPTGAQVNLAVAGANSPTVGRGAVTPYPIDLQGTNRSALGAWDIGASAFLSQRYGTGSGAGTTTMGGWPLQGVVQLPQNWVNSNEWAGTTSNAIVFPATGTGGSWSCGSTNYGPYTAGSQASLQQAINDAETCRTNTSGGTLISIPPGLYSGSFGLFLPQTAGDTSTNFIVLTSSTPLPTGQTACSHGIQDNVVESSQPGIRNLGCNGSSMSYQLGTTITAVAGAFTLANGVNTNSSAYNDVASMWTVENTGTNHNAMSTCATVSAGSCTQGWDANNVGPHHYAILNAELRPQAGLASTAAPLSVGQGSETMLSQIPSHIHLAYSYLHGDWTDAAVSGGAATAGPTGANSLPNIVSLAGCIDCSLAYNYMDRAIRPGGEGHGIGMQLTGQIKIVHNWIEGQSIGVLCGGQSNQIGFTGFVGCTDIEDRANRYTYPYSWMLAYNAGVINQVTKNGSTGSNYVVGDVLNLIETGGSGGTITVATVSSGIPQTYTVTTQGSGYSVFNGLSTSCVSCASGGSGAVVNIVTGYEPNNTLNGGANYVRKNSHEMKVGERYLMDGNIFENVDNSGAQNGTTISTKTDNNSSSNSVSNYWVIDENTTITNNLLRNSCNGPSLGYRSNSVGGDGGGIAFPTQLQIYANNLLYGYGVSLVPGCAGVSPQFGFRVAVTGNAAIWPSGHVTATRDSTGTIATLTLTSSLNPDLSVSDTNVGDPVNVYGCTGDTTFNTGNANLGPPALSGTLVNGLTVVYASSGPANSTDSTCSFNTGQGWPNFLTFNHNSDFATNAAFANDAYSSTNSGSNPLTFSRNLTFTNSIIVGGGVNSSRGEGTRSQTQAFDATTLTFNNIILAGRDALVICPGHSAGAGGMAACYTEYSAAHAAITPPVTIYGVPTGYCTGNDPTTGGCVGVIGAMSTSSFPTVLNDWHQFRLCHAGDAACNNNASVYAAGQVYQASDGGDLGASLPAIDAAQIRNIYSCASACGPGPYPDH